MKLELTAKTILTTKGAAYIKSQEGQNIKRCKLPGVEYIRVQAYGHASET
jgi:hypothetical protein